MTTHRGRAVPRPPHPGHPVAHAQCLGYRVGRPVRHPRLRRHRHHERRVRRHTGTSRRRHVQGRGPGPRRRAGRGGRRAGLGRPRELFRPRSRRRGRHHHGRGRARAGRRVRGGLHRRPRRPHLRAAARRRAGAGGGGGAQGRFRPDGPGRELPARPARTWPTPSLGCRPIRKRVPTSSSPPGWWTRPTCVSCSARSTSR